MSQRVCLFLIVVSVFTVCCCVCQDLRKVKLRIIYSSLYFWDVLSALSDSPAV